MARNPRWRIAANGTLIAVFVAMLWIPVVASVLRMEEKTDTNEKRAPAKLPVPDAGSIHCACCPRLPRPDDSVHSCEGA